jgi:hypothetical protein
MEKFKIIKNNNVGSPSVNKIECNNKCANCEIKKFANKINNGKDDGDCSRAVYNLIENKKISSEVILSNNSYCVIIYNYMLKLEKKNMKNKIKIWKNLK